MAFGIPSATNAYYPDFIVEDAILRVLQQHPEWATPHDDEIARELHYMPSVSRILRELWHSGRLACPAGVWTLEQRVGNLVFRFREDEEPMP